VLNEPCSGITDPQIPLQSQRGQARLGLTDEIDRQKPNSQWQLGTLEESPCNKRRLVSTSLALKRFTLNTLWPM
jgi:hypothetical protein